MVLQKAHPTILTENPLMWCTVREVKDFSYISNKSIQNETSKRQSEINVRLQVNKILPFKLKNIKKYTFM